VLNLDTFEMALSLAPFRSAAKCLRTSGRVIVFYVLFAIAFNGL
jgi:hypothetical protein